MSILCLTALSSRPICLWSLLNRQVNNQLHGVTTYKTFTTYLCPCLLKNLSICDSDWEIDSFPEHKQIKHKDNHDNLWYKEHIQYFPFNWRWIYDSIRRKGKTFRHHNRICQATFVLNPSKQNEEHWQVFAVHWVYGHAKLDAENTFKRLHSCKVGGVRSAKFLHWHNGSWCSSYSQHE